MQQHLQMSLTLCTGTLKHMTVSRCVFKAAAQPGFPTSLTTLALNNVTLGLDQVFLALSPLNNLQVLCFCHDTYSYIPLKHLLQYSRKECFSVHYLVCRSSPCPGSWHLYLTENLQNWCNQMA